MKTAANGYLLPRGHEIVRRTPERFPVLQLMSALQRFGVDLVVDVGANVGQFALDLWGERFAGRIFSIEPLPEAHRGLVTAAAGRPNWSILPRTAVGATEREIEFFVAGNSVSSSALPMLDRHALAAAGSATVGTVKVPQTTLDRLVLDDVRSARSALIKVDTQGYERAVLEGADECLKLAALVQLELSLQPLYEGQPLWLEMIEFMRERGYEIWALSPEFSDERTGQLLQVNGTFARMRGG